MFGNPRTKPALRSCLEISLECPTLRCGRGPLNAVSIPRMEHAMSKVVAIMFHVARRLRRRPERWRGRSVRLVPQLGQRRNTHRRVGPHDVQVSGPSAEHFRDLTSGLGACSPADAPSRSLTAGAETTLGDRNSCLPTTSPSGWPRPNSTVHFVMDGIESAVNQAKTRRREVRWRPRRRHHPAMPECWLLDEIHVDIAAFCLAPEFDSSTASPARQSSLATRR